MANILKKASIDISTAFNENKAKQDVNALKRVVSKSSEELKAERLRELDLLRKEGKISEEQLAKLRKTISSNTFNEELNREKRLYALRLQDEKKLAKQRASLSERIGSLFSLSGTIGKSPGGALRGAAGKMLPGAMAGVGSMPAAAAVASVSAFVAASAIVSKKSAQIAAEYEKQLNIIQSVTNATESERASYTEVIGGLGASATFSASEVAKGFEALVRSGLTINQANLTIPGTVDLAAAQAVTIEQAGELVTTTANQFALESDQATRIADVITTALSGSAQNMDNFQEALKYCGQGLNSIGVSLEESSALVMTLADVGVKGSSAGNALKNLAQRLNANQDKLKALGVEVANANGEFRAIPDILKDIRQATSAYTDTERASFFKDTFGSNFANPIASLVSNADKVASNVEALRASSGATANAVAIMGQGVDALSKGLGSKLEAVAIKIGDAIKPLTMGLLSAFNDFVTGFSNAIEPYLKELSNIFSSLFGSSSGGTLAENIGRVAAYVTGTLATTLANFATLIINILGGVESLVTGLNSLISSLSKGSAISVAEYNVRKNNERYSDSVKKFNEARSKLKDANDNGADQTIKNALAQEFYLAAQKMNEDATRLRESVAEFRTRVNDKYLDKRSGKYRWQYDPRDEEIRRIGSVFNWTSALTDDAIKKNAIFNNIDSNAEFKKRLTSGGVSGYIGEQGDETPGSISVEPSSTYTKEQQARLNQAAVIETSKNLDELVKLGRLDEESKDKLLDALTNAKTQDDFNKALTTASNEYTSIKSLVDAQGLTSESKSSASNGIKELGLDLSEEDLLAFRTALDSFKTSGDFSEVLKATKIESDAIAPKAIQSAFAELDYSGDYKNKVEARLDKLVSLTEKIKSNTQEENNNNQYGIITL